MSKNEKRLQMNLRISEKKKKKWKDYTVNSDFKDITKLIKYCVDGYIDGLLVEVYKIKNKEDKTEELSHLGEIIKILKEERDLLISKLNGMKKISLEEQEIMNIKNYKNQILNFLEIVGKATNDKIAGVVGLELPKTQKILNQLELEQGLIRMNKDTTYELVD